MDQVTQFVLLGLATGSLYALTAHGLVVIHRGSGVLNLAQGAFAMCGAFLYHRVGDEQGWSAPVRFVVALGVVAVLGVATQVGLMRQLRQASPLVRLVATLGVMFVLLAAANALFGDTGQNVKTPLPDTVRHPFSPSVSIGEDRLWLIGIAVVVTGALSLVYRTTPFGRRTQAVAENPRAAAALGYSPNRIAAANWAVGGALASLAGILIAPILLLQPATLTLTVLRALAAALVGRFMSFWATLAGAFGIGIAESLLSRFVAHEGLFEPVTSQEGLLFGVFSAQSVGRSVAFLAIVVVLVASGRGLPVRGELLDRLPAVGTGRISWPTVPVASGALAVLTLSAPDKWATALTVSMATAIILLSIVVVTGFLGQLSLAQVALAGVGAWIAGRLSDAHGLPFAAALIIGAVVTIPVGALLALPATRTRGLNLAVLSFGMSVCIFELVLANPSLTGGLAGTRIDQVSILGFDLDPFRHPGRYGVLVAGALVLALVGVSNVRRGRTGRRLIAVRGNERAAAALGVDVARAKLYAFALGAGIAAVGGILLAFRQHALAYASFGTVASIQSVLLVTIGGVGYVMGAVFGAILAPGGVAARLADEVGLGGDTLDVLSGLMLLAVLLANPNGMIHGPTQLLSRRRARPPATVPPVAPLNEPVRGQVPRRVLRASGMTVRFGGVTAVDDISFEIRPGEVLGIIGPNGAGKTTLLDALTGFVALTKGHISLDSTPIDRWPPHRRATAGIGRSFQSLELFEDLTVSENLLVASEAHSHAGELRDLVAPGEPNLSASAGLAVTDFGLSNLLDRRPDELPYGTRRLVAIARVMASSPSIVLLDEPAAGLSDAESRELGDLIRAAASRDGQAVALIDHDMDLVMSVCDRIIVLDAGRMIAEGPPPSIANDPLVAAAYLGGSSESVEMAGA